jgi:hypothetical protein
VRLRRGLGPLLLQEGPSKAAERCEPSRVGYLSQRIDYKHQVAEGKRAAASLVGHTKTEVAERRPVGVLFAYE